VPNAGPVISEALATTPSSFAGPVVSEILAALPSTFGGPVVTGTLATLPSTFGGPVVDEQLSVLPPPPVPKRLAKRVGRPYALTYDAPSLLKTTTGVSLASSGSKSVYTAPAGPGTVITLVVVRCVSATGVTAEAIARVTTGGSDVYPAQQLSGLNLPNKRWIFPVGQGTAPLMLSGGDLTFEIMVAAIAAAQLVDVDVFGHEL